MSHNYNFKQAVINEIYLDINGFPNYQVSNLGNIKNILTGKLLKPWFNHGYKIVSLSDANKTIKKQPVHRIVIEAFAPNIDNKPFVDHIDNDRTNNHIDNLRYATPNENNFNQSLNTRNTSGVKGVSWNKEKQKWASEIKHNGIRYRLGYFVNIEDAKKARQKKALELFGAYINACEK